MRTMTCLFAAALAVELPAQQDQPAKDAPRVVNVDKVVATVNDSAILLSAVRSRASGTVNTIETERGRRLQPPELLAVLKEFLEQVIDEYSMAQAATSFGVASPEAIEQALKDELDRDEAAQLRDFGTYPEYSRELQKRGRVWPTYQRQQRIEKLFEFAKSFAIGMRMQKQTDLYLTPKMLRETYRKRRVLFVHGAAADVESVLFTGPDAQANAEKAAAMWTRENLMPGDFRDRFPGSAIPSGKLNNITDGSRKSLDDALVDFAIAGPVDHVSAPMPVQGGFRIVRIAGYTPAADGKFEDPEVQLRLREICEKSVLGEFWKQALERAADRTEVWRSYEFR